MQNKNKLSQIMMIAGSVIFLTASGVLASLSIETNMENAVQTIKRVIITDDGTASGDVLIQLNPADGSKITLGTAEISTNTLGEVVVENTDGTEAKLQVLGNFIAGESNNIATAQYASVVGGENNVASGVSSTVAGGVSNIAGAIDSTIVGGEGNTITANGRQATIGGGKNNIANAYFSTIPGGVGNETNADYTFAAGHFAKANHVGSFVRSNYNLFTPGFTSTDVNQFLIQAHNGVGINTANPGAAIQVVGSAIFGAEENTAVGINSFVAGGAWGSLNHASGTASSIGGGVNNSAEGDYSSVGGGAQNSVPSNFSTIGGGTFNSVEGDNSSIGGGSSNSVEGDNSSIGGGGYNIASGTYSTIGGGSNNGAQGYGSTIAGGRDNATIGHSSSILGGFGNTTTAPYATVIGGSDNTAAGTNSLAGGNKAQANHDGTFVRSDGQSTYFSSETTGQFLIRAYNGVGINTNDPKYGALQIKGAGNGGGIALYRGAGTTARMYINDDDYLHIVRGAQDSNGITISIGGDVGIGSDEPEAGLEVKTWEPLPRGGRHNSIQLTNDTHAAITYKDDDDNEGFLQGFHGVNNMIYRGRITDRSAGNGSYLMTLDQNATLDVNGPVRATQYCDSAGNNCNGAGAPTAGEIATLLATKIYTKHYYYDSASAGSLACNSSDIMIAGGCQSDGSTKRMQGSYPDGTYARKCDFPANGFHIYVICLDNA